MKIKPFSKKQLMLLTWWCSESKNRSYDAVIADGAVRSGKTLCMSISFVSWAFSRFHNQDFAICGKTVTSLRRNVIRPLIEVLHSLSFHCEEKLSKNYIEITYKNIHNRFYLFGGKDEGSASLIQGITLSGLMLDEVALMPRSFVEQALARCSVTGSKFWFNCNPEHPFHWFYTEWIQKASSKNALYLHFQMEDNPSLSKDILKRYQGLYSGTFYERFVLGKWVQAQGLIYPMFHMDSHSFATPPQSCSCYYVSCDYGTVNPTSMGLWGESNGKWYRLAEYYYASKVHMAHKTDEEYYQALENLCGHLPIRAVIVDPSAASFIECIRRHGKYKVVPAKNDVLTGIRQVSDALKSNKLLFSEDCKDTIREFSLYVWEQNARGDCPKKENDHAMDDIRYFVNTVVFEKQDNFFVMSAIR
ncbi:PBSX family phage terminase large subunit [Paludicola sp. MB14-C6]|uniref:PBSX family phage terminase large subunit n=1 Tax=Paludihabitans sp. MB14-C6 TaxID=3070656 RepID=UPI0027DD5FF2|nr:PBSX family phage terminase large subunit [Paludicola sp. MB14-C6]WMJ23723.1 PBSX family phage terminase large subunit [Paludicola sp. MB14-C6]